VTQACAKSAGDVATEAGCRGFGATVAAAG
jgi:hypothetical protein